MGNTQIDHDVSLIVFGEINEAFKPSQNEQDAWTVLGWMQSQRMRVNYQSLSPLSICQSLLRLVA